MGALTGCGSKDTASTGAEGGVFKIGGMGPLTGDAASYGKSVKQGAEIAIKEINDAGGVNGMQLELYFEDDEATADTAITAYNTLMDKNVNAILGAVTSGACLAITDLTNEDGILQITPSGSAKEITKNDNVFRLCFTDPTQGVAMADYAIDELGYKNFAVIYDVSSDYSSGMMDAFVAEVEAKGGSIVASESFTSGEFDFNTQLTTIKSSGADAIFVPAYYQDVAYILNQANKLGIDLPFLGGDGWDGVIAQLEDTSVAEGAIFLSPFLADDTSENIQSFVKKYQDATGETPDQFAADGYDTVYVIKAAIEKAGSTKSEDLIKAMTEIKVDGLTGSMTFDSSGEPEKGAKFIEIKDGKYTAR